MDVRFKLLAFVPTVTGVGVNVVVKDHPGTRLSVAALGLVVTFAITLYEVRNSQSHDAAVDRMGRLQEQLGLPRSVRPGPIRLLGVKAWHDRALGMVYGASCGAWAGLLVFAADARAARSSWLSAAAAVVVGALVYEEVIRLNKRGMKWLGANAASAEE